MNNLNVAIQDAYAKQGQLQEANKVYLEFIKANFIIPIEKNQAEHEPIVLFFGEKDHLFLPVFTDIEYLNAWACEIKENIQLLKLTGVDLLKGIGDNVSVSLDIGSLFYKEFNPSEIARMRSMVIKLFKN